MSYTPTDDNLSTLKWKKALGNLFVLLPFSNCHAYPHST